MKNPVVIFSLLLLAHFSNAQSDHDQIRKQREMSNQAIARHDTSALSQAWHDDIHVTTSRSVTAAGKQANLRAFQLEFTTKQDLLYVRTSKNIEVFAQWNMASESGNWTGTWSVDGKAAKIGGSYYAKWHKVNGTWKIRAEIYTPTSCEGDEYCKSFRFADSTTPIVVQNFYFPKPGKEAEVLEYRKKASQVRAQLGLAVGRILQRTSESTTQPYLIWECEYPSMKAREEDVARLDQSDDFKKVSDHMGTLLEKFDRSVSVILK